MRLNPPIKRVETEERAKQMIQIADSMLIEAIYTYNGRWYIVSFDCSNYVFLFLNGKLLKQATE